MTNIDKVKDAIDNLLQKNGNKGVTTLELVDNLNMDRSLVSRYLNLLVNDGTLKKSTTRPVRYMKNETIENTYDDLIKESTTFDKFIGIDGSLNKAIRQCIASVFYPDGGLPILLTGSSGVGKSCLASLIYQYAVEQKIISSKSKFIVFNCADYANNGELLASKLFGYRKGAFTDAIDDYEGVIAQADGGYLFLDEVHRLSPEGQEKLFLFLDKGVYQPFGDKNYYPVKVRLICATTENPKEAMIRTFMRRIPIQVYLPDMKKRPNSERMAFIQQFYKNETHKFKKTIKVNKEVVNYLMSCSLEGNIGELANLIKVSCANAYQGTKNQEMIIQIKDISIQSDQKICIRQYFKKEYLYISPEKLDNIQNENINIFVVEIFSEFKKFYNFLINDTTHINSDECLRKKALDTYKIITDIIYFENKGKLDESDGLLLIYIREAIQQLYECYGVKKLIKQDKIIANILNVLHSNEFVENEQNELLKECQDILKNRKIKTLILVDRFFEYLRDSLNYKETVAERLLLSLWLISQTDLSDSNNINVIILAHGNSTASSIASVVNTLYSSYIVEAFDMAIDMELFDIVNEIKDYAQYLNKHHPVIFLVDMGSLFEIYPYIKDYFKDDVVVINNITTQLALAVGSGINQRNSVSDIMNEIAKASELKYKFYKKNKKQKVIVTTCATGIGTAQRIRDIIERCLPVNCEEESGIKIITCDYFSLKNSGKSHEIFQKYDVLLVITTVGLGFKDIPTMIFTEMLDKTNLGKLKEVLKEVYDYQAIDMIIQNLMKSLTIENIISRLTMLNPIKVVENVSIVISEMEKALDLSLSENHKLSLYIHIAMMLERCYFHRDVTGEDYKIITEKTKLDTLRDIFNNFMTDFDLDIPYFELDMIFRIIDSYENNPNLIMDGEDE